MNNKINVLELELHNDTAKEAMQKVMDYMRTDPLNIVEFISSDSLLLSKDDEVLRDNIAQSDLVLTVEKSFLELAGVTDRRRLQEAENGLLLKMILHYFHKNRSRVFLLVESEEDRTRLKDYFEGYYSGIDIVGTEIVSKDSSMDDMILNCINGVEAECVISVLPSPLQEAFVVRNKILLNARLWLGLGKKMKLPLNKREKKPVRDFLIKLFLKREIEKEKQKRGNA
ncbi:WecB/TagA/CpsF family glycosyltransferase [Lachnospiraceae bacterium EP-SM-12S-S03]|nr:WecB/TagA/CpsF family glycosyltransferase [Lachnospiraceae bacterium EP-SM-12S-S03]